jgi:hypothetical protein
MSQQLHDRQWTTLESASVLELPPPCAHSHAYPHPQQKHPAMKQVIVLLQVVSFHESSFAITSPLGVHAIVFLANHIEFFRCAFGGILLQQRIVNDVLLDDSAYTASSCSSPQSLSP